MVSIAQLAAIPYLDAPALVGRFVPSLTFYDGDWRLWMAAGESGEMLFEMTGKPAESCYFAAEPEAPTDLFLPFLDFLAQRGNFMSLSHAFSGIHDDIFNLSGSLAKLSLLEQSRASVPHGLSRMAGSEVEYILMVLRSMLDLFQEGMMKLWDNVALYDDKIEKRRLKQSFADMINFKGAVSPVDEIATRFGLPMKIADCYDRARAIFEGLKRIRDNIVHHGSQPPHIFGGDGPFLIALRDNPFRNVGIWEEAEREENDLLPLLPVLEVLIYRSFEICNELSAAYLQAIQLPPPTAPSLAFFARGYFTKHLVDAVSSGRRRADFPPLKPSSL